MPPHLIFFIVKSAVELVTWQDIEYEINSKVLVFVKFLCESVTNEFTKNCDENCA